MTTVLDIATRALEHLNVREAAQEIAPENADLCARALGSLLDALQLDPQACLGLQEFVYTPSGGQATISIGPTGQIVTPNQPVRLEMSSFYRVNGVDRPIGIANSMDEYTSQASKTVQGLANFIRYERSNTGNGTIYLYPASNGSEELHLWARQDVVSGYSTLALGTTLNLPNGYKNYLEWALAAEIATDFAIQGASQDIERKAAIALRRLKRANFVSAQIQAPLGTVTRRYFNIATM